jgi:hypothetical protein
MDRLIQVLRAIDEVEVERARILAGNETWKGPRADAVREDLKRVQLILSEAIELAVHHRSSHMFSIDAHRPDSQWDF